MRLGDLTTGERLLLDRRRRSESQPAAADRLQVSLYRYRLLEWDLVRHRPPQLGRLRPHERCFILRRRDGMPLAELARKLGTSRWWVTQMEYGKAPADRLVEFWAPALCRAG